MPYTKQVWTNEPSTASPLSAARLNIAEGGIGQASDRLDAIETTRIVVVGSASSPITNASIPRPAGAPVVYWMCDTGVTPTNAAAGDLIWNADA